MEKETLNLNFTLQLEVNDITHNYQTLGEAIEAGFAKIVSSDVSIVSDVRGVCKIEEILDQAKAAILKGLMED